MTQIPAKQVSGLRTLATSQPIFYVATTGSDSNDGLTVGTAFLTLQKAIDVLTTIDCNGFDPIINLAAGTYVQPLGGLVLKSCTGVATRVTIIGEAGANRINYKIQAQAASPTDLSATAIVKNTPTAYRFVGVEIGANFSHNNFPKYVRASTPIEFEDCCFRGNNNTHDGIVSYASNTITFLGITQLEGTFRWPLDMLHSFVAFLPVGTQKPTFTTSSGCEFAVFLNGTNTTCLAHDTVHSGTGSFVGKRFELIEGRVETYNEGAGLPGNSAGTVTYPGVTTDLSIGTRTSTALDIVSSSGADTTLPAATTSLAGLLTGADKTKLNNAIESTQLGANNGVAQLGSTGKHLPGQALPNSVTYTSSTGVFDFTWADGSTQSINLPIENLFQNVSYNSGTQTLTLTTSGGGTIDISLATLVDLPEIVVAQSDPATTPSTGQRLYLRSDTGEYWIAASGSWQGKYLAFTAAERAKLGGIETGAINQTTADGRYRLQSNNIPTSEVTDLAEFVRDTIGATLVQGSNITITPNDPGDTITISATGAGSATTPNLAVSTFFWDAETPPDAVSGPVARNVSGSGAWINTGFAESGRVGVVELTTGSGATNRVYCGTGFASNSGRSISLGNGAATGAAGLRLHALSTSTDRYIEVVGFFSGHINGAIGNGCYFIYDEGGLATGTPSGNWYAACANNNTRTFVDTGVAASTSWINLRVEVNSAGTSATFFINGTLVATINTNLPIPANLVGLGVNSLKQVGATAILTSLDWMFFYKALTASRGTF